MTSPLSYGHDLLTVPPHPLLPLCSPFPAEQLTAAKTNCYWVPGTLLGPQHTLGNRMVPAPKVLIFQQ